jgi:hypothetical protein
MSTKKAATLLQNPFKNRSEKGGAPEGFGTRFWVVSDCIFPLLYLTGKSLGSGLIQKEMDL